MVFAVSCFLLACPYVLFILLFLRVAVFNTFSYQLISLWRHQCSGSLPIKRCSLSFEHCVALLLMETKHFLLLLTLKAFYLWSTSWLLFQSRPSQRKCTVFGEHLPLSIIKRVYRAQQDFPSFQHQFQNVSQGSFNQSAGAMEKEGAVRWRAAGDRAAHLQLLSEVTSSFSPLSVEKVSS